MKQRQRRRIRPGFDARRALGRLLFRRLPDEILLAIGEELFAACKRAAP